MGASRNATNCRDSDCAELVTVDDVLSPESWAAALADADCVVHLAARVHVMQETAADPLAKFREANVSMTKIMAEEAAKAGVRRIIYLSTIKVLGENTDGRQAFSKDDLPNPQDPYAISKFEAEGVLLSISRESGIEVVILRPPLVYGPGVGGNLNRLFGLVSRGIPLPFASVDNARSMVGVSNLCDVIERCIHSEPAAGEVLLVADQKPLSTPGLLRVVAACMNKPSRLWPIPQWLLRGLGKLAGKDAEIERLCGDLVIDCSPTEKLLAWTGRTSPQQELQAAVDAFLESRSERFG